MPRLPDFNSLNDLVDNMDKLEMKEKVNKKNKEQFVEELLILSILKKNTPDNIKRYLPASVSIINSNFLNLSKEERTYLDKKSFENEFFDIFIVDDQKKVFEIFNKSEKGYHLEEYHNILEELLQSFRISYNENGKILDSYSIAYEIEDNEFYEIFFDLSQADIFISSVSKITCSQ